MTGNKKVFKFSLLDASHEIKAKDPAEGTKFACTGTILKKRQWNLQIVYLSAS